MANSDPLQRLIADKEAQLNKVRNLAFQQEASGRPSIARVTREQQALLDEELDFLLSLEVDEEFTDEDESVDATDAARELAEENDLDLTEIEGTGAEGRIVVSDVRDALDEEE